MKSKIFFSLIFLLSISTLNVSKAQQKTAQFIQFNNFTASFTVPEGKTWIINQIFSSFSSEVKTNLDGTKTVVPVRIFIKTLNGDIKTDYAGNRFGPQVFQSNNSSATVSYPIVLPEKTVFSLVIIKGDPGNCSAFDGSGYMSFYEMVNS